MSAEQMEKAKQKNLESMKHNKFNEPHGHGSQSNVKPATWIDNGYEVAARERKWVEVTSDIVGVSSPRDMFEQLSDFQHFGQFLFGHAVQEDKQHKIQDKDYTVQRSDIDVQNNSFEFQYLTAPVGVDNWLVVCSIRNSEEQNAVEINLKAEWLHRHDTNDESKQMEARLTEILRRIHTHYKSK
eukprot:TRINITY_DN5447_c0_g1_i1.p1 TRINITY_DN5447_c0_g1~~TRINITY_DN5447_c0_g1_i1.p1  ORF type:complete len:184 (+),score=37.84 TRINITY_DN5447_c0_g1_i1:122-673(+)